MEACVVKENISLLRWMLSDHDSITLNLRGIYHSSFSLISLLIRTCDEKENKILRTQARKRHVFFFCVLHTRKTGFLVWNHAKKKNVKCYFLSHCAYLFINPLSWNLIISFLWCLELWQHGLIVFIVKTIFCSHNMCLHKTIMKCDPLRETDLFPQGTL